MGPRRDLQVMRWLQELLSDIDSSRCEIYAGTHALRDRCRSRGFAAGAPPALPGQVRQIQLPGGTFTQRKATLNRLGIGICTPGD